MADGSSMTLEERIDRMESTEQIRQLAARYALALDTRNFDDMVQLFVPNVQVGRDTFGRDKLRDWFVRTMSNTKSSIHFVGNHIIDLDPDDPDKARGVVYCRDELDRGDIWIVGKIQYWDSYERQEGKWFFRRRKLMRWYAVDALDRPGHAKDVTVDSGGGRSLQVGQLPEAWPSWEKYWTRDVPAIK